MVRRQGRSVITEIDQAAELIDIRETPVARTAAVGQVRYPRGQRIAFPEGIIPVLAPKGMRVFEPGEPSHGVGDGSIIIIREASRWKRNAHLLLSILPRSLA